MKKIIRIIVFLSTALLLASCGGGSGGGGESPAGDSTSPSNPANLTAVAVSANQLNLSWSASSDNVGVAGYKIFRDGTLLTSVTATSFSDARLTAKTQYCYAISALDAAGNESGQSLQACVSTLDTGIGSFLFFETIDGGAADRATPTSRSIVALDPTTPTFPITVDSGSTGQAIPIPYGTFDPATKEVSGLHIRTVIYEKGGKWFKASALKGGAAPTPVQLSNENGASSLSSNDITVAADFAEHNNARLIYHLPGPDGFFNTNDDVWMMTKVGMAATAPPITAKEPLAPIYDKVAGALTGWLAIDGNAVKRFDADFTVGTAVTVMNFTTNAMKMDFTFDVIFLRIDNGLYAYNTATGNLSGSIHTFPPFPPQPSFFKITTAKDATNLYFLDDGIYAVSLGGTTIAALIASTTELTQMIESINVTDTKVIYEVRNPESGQSDIRSVLKSGGTPTILTTSTNFLSVVATKGIFIYYNIFIPSRPTGAGFVKDDGSGVTDTPSTFWVGSSFPAIFDPSTSKTPQYLLKASVSVFNAVTGFGGGTLESFDTATNTRQAIIGTIPAEIFNMNAVGIGANILGIGSGPTPMGGDLFYMNLTTNNSLTRITNTPSTAERIISLLD